jgi:hypothetical protein
VLVDEDFILLLSTRVMDPQMRHRRALAGAQTTPVPRGPTKFPYKRREDPRGKDGAAAAWVVVNQGPLDDDRHHHDDTPTTARSGSISDMLVAVHPTTWRQLGLFSICATKADGYDFA